VRFASLGSGSAGNALVIESGGTRVLLDCGFSTREIINRLGRIGLTPEQLSGIVITHEHDDHAGGAFKLAARYGIGIWATHGTLRASQRYMPEQAPLKLHVIDSHTPLRIDAIELRPYPVPHDAREPVQFVFGDGQFKLGVLTDTGSITPHIQNMLTGCHALVLECNHDLDMLMNGPYAWPLKQRVGGRYGHLDNTASAGLLAGLDNSKLQHIVAAHLSEKNNTPQLAATALADALHCNAEWIGIADQQAGFDWRMLQ